MAFVLDLQAPLAIALWLGAGDAQVERRRERRLEPGYGFGLFFGWERRGVLSFAFNLDRPSLCTVL